jgi:hypothetical protein
LRTLIVSDLHLGSASGVDVLRRPELRAPLLAALADGVERLVLLGDTLELRHGPRRDALAAARPVFEDLGRALPDGEIVVLAGNHDHALVEPWLERRDEQPAGTPLALEQRFAAADASPMLAQLAAWAAPARLTTAYPGLWVRPDIYATHGHYLDCHLTVPTMERLGIGAMGRILRRPARAFTGPDDYEAVTNPVFAWIDAIARQASTGPALDGGLTVRAWRVLRGDGEDGRAGDGGAPPSDAALGVDGVPAGVDGLPAGLDGVPAGVDGLPAGLDGVPAAGVRHNGLLDGGLQRGRAALVRTLRVRALTGGFPLLVGALNRAGLGPFNADLSPDELRRAGLRAMGEVAVRLGLGDAYVIFGHTHRAGPLPADRAAEWVGPGGAWLMNTGCWSYDRHFLTATPGESPYWPGSAVLVDDDGPPVVRRLLAEWTHEQLAPPAAPSSDVPREDAWAYTPEHRGQLARAREDAAQGRAGELSEDDLRDLADVDG